MAETNGSSNGLGSVQERPRRRRPPTVDEAIQYSPFASIVPFDPNIIPVPCAYPSTSLSSILSDSERQTASRLLESLDADASSQSGTSAQLESTLKELQTLLRPEDLTQYIFKRPAGSSAGEPHDQRSPGSPTGLGPFAKLVAKSTRASYRYPTPESLKSSSPRKGQVESGRQSKSPVVSPSKERKNTQAFNRNSRVIEQASTGQQHVANGQFHSSNPLVVIPSATASNLQQQYEREPGLNGSILNVPSNVNSAKASIVVSLPGMPSVDPSQYHRDPALDAAMLKSEEFNFRKRKRLDQEDEDITIDHQERTLGAVREFQQLLNNLFEVADELEPDRHGYFESVLPDQEEISELSTGFLARLEGSFQTVVKVRAFAQLGVEELVRLQRICSKSLSFVNGLPLSVPVSTDEDSLRSWVVHLTAADNSLQASKIILKIMTTGADDKQLHSEEILQDLLGSLKHILEDCVIQVVEQRSSSEKSEFLRTNSEAKTLLGRTLQKAGRVIRLLGDLILQADVSESVVTAIEFLSTKLLFVENATVEKEAILGIQKFENVRRHAMDVVSKLFLKHPEQRSSIFDEILSSLEKLPTTRQGVKHFRSAGGKQLRVVSALIMQLIQTSTIPSSSPKRAAVNGDDAASQDEDMSDEDYDDRSDAENDRVRKSAPKGTASSRRGDGAIRNLHDTITPLLQGAQKSTNYVITYLVNRALASTKSGDEPYRQLLDDFTEDFVSVLGSVEFPAAELLLRFLLTRLVNIAEGEKSTAPSKNMALDLMGRMGSAIADLRSFATRTLRSLEETHNPTHGEILQTAEETLENKVLDTEFLKTGGPYHQVVEWLYGKEHEDLRTQSARCYDLAQWAQNICNAEDSLVRDGDDSMEADTLQKLSKLASWLSSAMEEPDRLLDSSTPDLGEANPGRLAPALITINSPFCKALPRILSILVLSMSSTHVTVRNRGLKSVVQVLEKDASILERSRNVLNHIVNATYDASPMVRESALSLLGRCISLKPELEAQFLKTILAKTSDPGISVRKRAIKLLKDIYARNTAKEVRAAIADAILVCMEDTEESVKEVARQIIEEIWMTPFHGISPGTEQSIKVKQELQSHVHLIVATAQRGDHVLQVLETLYRDALGKDTKDRTNTQNMCKVLVVTMFDMIIDNDSNPEKPNQAAVLQTLTIFAKAEPRLFNSEQMETLRPYIENLSSSDDLLVYRSVIVIFRWVLPILPPLQHSFLQGVQQVLFSSISRLGKVEMNEVAICLSIIDGVLNNTERLVNLIMSVLVGIEKERAAETTKSSDPKALARLKRYVMIAGYFGKACDLEAYKDAFAQRLSAWNVSTVSGLMTDIVCQFADSKQSEGVREQALESVCLICQAWPKNFLKQNVTGSFNAVFLERNRTLETVVLTGFKAFYLLEEARSKSRGEATSTNGAASGLEKLSTSMILSDNDGASTSIAQQFLPDIIRIALESNGGLALTATELVASINRQGLVHPKESGPALVALETCPDALIAKIAFEGHQQLHHKHESMLEKEYLKAVERAFIYQKDTVGQLSGVDASLRPKLHSFYEVLKQGSIALRKKLLVNLCAKINIDPSKLSYQADLTSNSQYARFVLENLALFEYGRIDELLHLITCIEKIFTTTGNAVSQRVENLLNLNMEPGLDIANPHTNGDMTPELQALTIASVVITMLWETRSFLRRTWNLPQAKENKQKASARDVNKAPTKSTHAPSPERLLEKFADLASISLANEEIMTAQCRAFVELLSIDGDLKVENSSDDDGLDSSVTRFATPSEEGAARDGTPAPGSVGSMRIGKRKGSASAGSTPKKPRGRPPGSGGGKRKSSLGPGAGATWDDDDMGWD